MVINVTNKTIDRNEMKKNQRLNLSFYVIGMSLAICLSCKPQTLTIKGIDFVFVKGGTFEMGDTFGDGEAHERPVHTVTVSDFYLGKTEVTNAQFAAFLKSHGKDTDDQGNKLFYEYLWGIIKSEDGWQASPGFENHPVVFVTWFGAATFARWAGCRLPTEAEWEYAARSGGNNEKWAGTSSDSALTDFAWYGKNSGRRTQPVALKNPNGLGLYDMSGNVWEWCADWYAEDYYQTSPEKNPPGPSSGTARVLRSGSWKYDERFCRATVRYRVNPENKSNCLGFRVARNSPR